MRHESDIDPFDTEYTTPAQAAEIRRMKAELPLWQEMELAKDVTVAIEPHAIDCFSTVAAKVDADTVKATDATYSKVFDCNAERPSWADYVAQIELHRALNNTEGMESEE